MQRDERREDRARVGEQQHERREPGGRPWHRGERRRHHGHEPPRIPERGHGCPEHDEGADDHLHDQQDAGRAAPLALTVGRHPSPHDPGPEQGDPLLAQRGAEHAVVLAPLREGRPPVAELGRHHRSLVVEHGRRRLPAVARDEAPQPHRDGRQVGIAVHPRLARVGRRSRGRRARQTGGHVVAASRHRILVVERRPHVEAVAVGGPLGEQQLVEGASVFGAERHPVSFARRSLATILPCGVSRGAAPLRRARAPIPSW